MELPLDITWDDVRELRKKRLRRLSKIAMLFFGGALLLIFAWIVLERIGNQKNVVALSTGLASEPFGPPPPAPVVQVRRGRWSSFCASIRGWDVSTRLDIGPAARRMCGM